MLLHLARISVIAIAVALVGGLGVLLARPQAPTVVAVVVPQAAAPAPTVVHAPVACWGYYCGWR